MSSYSVDNENRKAEAAHKTREDYKKREAELKKKQSAEVNRLNKEHGETIRKIQNQHEEQLEGLRNRNQETLTEQDRRYQGEINKIRETHKSQLKLQQMENENKFDAVNHQRQTELQKQQKVSESRESSLAMNYENDRNRMNETFSNSIDEMRKAQEEGLRAERNRSEAAHRREMSNLRTTQDNNLSDKTLELQNTRDLKNAEIRSLREKVITDREKVEADKFALVNQQQKTHNAHVGLMQKQYEENLEDLTRKYAQYNLEARSGRAEELENIKTIADRRLNEQVGKRERQLRDERMDHDLDTFLQGKAFQEEKKNYMKQMRDSLQNAENIRNNIYDSVNKESADEIKQMVVKNNKAMDANTKYYQGRLQQQSMKYDESIENQVNSLKTENDQMERTNKIYNQKLAYNLNKEKDDLETYYKNIIEEKDRLHQRDLVEQREKMSLERKEALSALQNRLRDTEIKNTERQNLLMQKYEKEIADIKGQNEAEKKRIVHNYEKRIEVMEKGFKNQLDTDRIASEQREKQLKDQFSDRVSQLENKHIEEKIKLAQKTK